MSLARAFFTFVVILFIQSLVIWGFELNTTASIVLGLTVGVLYGLWVVPQLRKS